MTKNTASDRPLVTLALFTFNQERYVRDALEAVFAQTYEPLEILITDDCSSDGTVAEIESVLSGYPERALVSLHCNETNLGWNRWGGHISAAVARARGKLVVLAAGDDVSMPDRVGHLVEAWMAAGRPSGVVHSAFQTLSDSKELNGQIRQEGRNFGDQSPLDAVRKDGEGLLGASMAFTPDLLDRFGPLEDETVFEDRVIGFRALLYGKVIFVEAPLVQYRLHAANVSGPNIYTDPKRWDRFCRGQDALYRSFRADYLKMHDSKVADPQVLAEIEKRAMHVGRTAKLVSGNPIERAMAAWHVTIHQRNLRYRLSFALKALGIKRLIGSIRA
ncbi:glycosyltransferase [Gemmobacter sp.]|uniref:glycosyltransferase n=1 Tax=Gemmobacter sp. TaxID=1898957 RepID=UPI002AFF97AA|nr:glycosyltransferase [Gemmobacter sp.]